MNATSTLVYPQKVLGECIVIPSKAGPVITPTYFTADLDNFLRGRKIIAIESYVDNDIQYSPISPGIKIIPNAAAIFASLVLFRRPTPQSPEGDFYKLPLVNTRIVNNIAGGTSGAAELFRMDPAEISWTDSYTFFANPITIVEPYSIPLLITYLLDGQDPEPYRTVKNKK